MVATERDIGRILEALDQGKIDRKNLNDRLGQTIDSMGEMRELMAAMRTEFMMMNERAEQANLLAAKVAILEASMGTIRNDLQALQSFIKLAKQFSIKVVIGVLVALVFGVSVFSKMIEWGLFKFGLR